jgi:hypothetical protein
MDWQDLLAQVTAWVAGLEPMHWLILSTGVAFLVLIAAPLAQSRRATDSREGLTYGGAGVAKQAQLDASAALEGISLSPIDSVFPRRPAQFLLLIVAIALGFAGVAWAFAPNRAQLLRSPEWLFQPFYIAAHLLTLRLFINVFTRNYAAGVSRLNLSRPQALRGIRPILGPLGALAAAAIAAPFCWLDLQYLLSDRYEGLGDGGRRVALDYVMWGVWSLEWFINAFIWILLISFMVKNCVTIDGHPFRDPIDAVLAEKQYRPFLQMSSQGATILLGFSAVTVAYIYVTGGELTDYLGLGITVALLIVCFVPPWVVLREKVDKAVKGQIMALRQEAGITQARAGLGDFGQRGNAGVDRSVDDRMDQVVALLKMWHLQNLYGSLGQTEARAIMLRLLAPAATIGWQLFQNHSELTQKLWRVMGALNGP